MYNEVTVWNIQEKRAATHDEIEELIDTGQLIINFFIDPTPAEVGQVFVDLGIEAVEKFALQYGKSTLTN